MKKIWNSINGHKTQVGAFLTLSAGFLSNKGLIDVETTNYILAVLGLWLTGSIYHSEKKKKK